MDAVVGKIDYGRSQILHGDHHIVVTKKLKSDNGKVEPGMPLALDSAGEAIPIVPVTNDLTGTVDGSNTDFTLASASEEIQPGSVIITHGAQAINDDGHGNLYGDGSGTVNYKTGAVSVTFDTAPDSGAPEMEHYARADSVLLEQIDTAFDNAGPAVVHGIVRKSKLTDGNGDPVPDSVIRWLSERGIFAT